MLEEKKIKAEGMVGLFYARIPHGAYISADSAVKGQPYVCPFCNCAMHVTKSSTGMKYFARNPGAVHTDPTCINEERKKVHHSFDRLNPEEFISELCHVSPKGGTKGGGGNTPGPGGNGSGDSEPEIRKSSFSNLKQIYDAGIYHLDPDDRQGEHKVSDFIITFKFGNQFFPKPDFRLGCRIVMARYDRFDSKARAILFSQFIKGGYNVKFRLVFPNINDFKKIRDKFAVFTEDEQTGKTILVKKHMVQDVLLACDNWVFISRDRCQDICSHSHNCEGCCGMYQAIFTAKGQLYLIPSDH